MRLIAVLSLAFVTASLSAGEVYRSVAPDGTVIYSDRPNGPGAEPVFVATRRPAPAPIPPAAAQPTAAAESATDALDEAEPVVDAQRIQQELAEQRARNCEIARSRAQNYSAAHRLYRQLPNGEREYLNDAEIDEARARAAADVEAWCN